MIVYNLMCRKKHRFEGWFPSYEGFQDQAAKGLISCPKCGSTKVEKMPHACAVHLRREGPRRETAREQRRQEAEAEPVSESDVKELLLRVHHYVKENSENVGPRFAEEARAIFYGRSKKRLIHGTSTAKEREEMDEEGIPYTILPKPDLDS